MDIMGVLDVVIPDCVVSALTSVCDATGLKWGVMSRKDYFFQPIRLHILMTTVAVLFCAILYQKSKGFRKVAVAQLTTAGAGWSTKCPINTAIGVFLLSCLATQVYAKTTRSKPLVQAGWLLMPCHMITIAWAYVMLRQKPRQYGQNSYVASLLIDYAWSPLGAIAAPDKGDHQFAFESQLFVIHHWLLVLLPVYYAARYHTLPLTREHVMHLTWLPTLLNFAVKTPLALLFGLNIDYMLTPPPVKGLPAVFSSIYYRPAYVPVFIALSCASNLFIRFTGEAVAYAWNNVDHLKNKAKRKIS